MSTTRTKAKSKASAKAAGKSKKPRQAGRPTTYTDKLAKDICLLIAEGLSLRSIAAAEGMPSKSTIMRWLAQREDFRDQYARAKELQADALAEEMLDIADDAANDWMEIHDKDGKSAGFKLNGEHVQRSRLRIEARKWLLSKLQPKKYGDRLDLNHGGQPENPLNLLLQEISGTATSSPTARLAQQRSGEEEV